MTPATQPDSTVGGGRAPSTINNTPKRTPHLATPDRNQQPPRIGHRPAARTFNDYSA
jgi:hypothetical protein